MSASHKTGIEVQFKENTAAKIIGKALHFLHLDKGWEKWVEATHVFVSLDGVEQELPLAKSHFFECSPGSHKLSVALVGPQLPGAVVTGKLLNTASRDVTVPEGKVSELVYTLASISAPIPGVAAHLEQVGERAAG